MFPQSFHSCLSAWAQQEKEYSILSKEGRVRIIYVTFSSRVRYDSPNSDLDEEWHLTENWFQEYQAATAPVEVSKAYFSSHDYWWYDTNSEMFKTALGSAAIAISASAAIILVSSRSLVMTLFSVISVAYVLASVTAMMVAADWRLGFLESICFAILIGISVDFVMHFSHAYSSSCEGRRRGKGSVTISKERRTKHALIYMGPSILAAAVTTLAGSLMMLFCVVTFFTKFATILFFTIIQSLIGSFVVFLTLTDTLGPSNPTYWADKLCSTTGTCAGETVTTRRKEKEVDPALPVSLSTSCIPSPQAKKDCDVKGATKYTTTTEAARSNCQSIVRGAVGSNVEDPQIVTIPVSENTFSGEENDEDGKTRIRQSIGREEVECIMQQVQDE